MPTMIIKTTTVTTTIVGCVEHVTHCKLKRGMRDEETKWNENAWKKKTSIKRHSYHRNTRVTVKERRWFRRCRSLNRQAWRRRGTAGRERRLCCGADSVSKRPPAFPFSHTPENSAFHSRLGRNAARTQARLNILSLFTRPSVRPTERARSSTRRYPHLYCYCSSSRVSSRRACRSGGNFVPCTGIVYRKKRKVPTTTMSRKETTTLSTGSGDVDAFWAMREPLVTQS